MAEGISPLTWPPCPCGKTWPVTLGPQAEYVEWCVVVLGEELLVTIGDRHFMVPRRCIAYHGITGVGLLSGTSGHREVVPR